jgi:hypothetical protein
VGIFIYSRFFLSSTARTMLDNSNTSSYTIM